MAITTWYENCPPYSSDVMVADGAEHGIENPAGFIPGFEDETPAQEYYQAPTAQADSLSTHDRRYVPTTELPTYFKRLRTATQYAKYEALRPDGLNKEMQADWQELITLRLASLRLQTSVESMIDKHVIPERHLDYINESQLVLLAEDALSAPSLSMAPTKNKNLKLELAKERLEVAYLLLNYPEVVNEETAVRLGMQDLVGEGSVADKYASEVSRSDKSLEGEQGVRAAVLAGNLMSRLHDSGFPVRWRRGVSHRETRPTQPLPIAKKTDASSDSQSRDYHFGMASGAFAWTMSPPFTRSDELYVNPVIPEVAEVPAVESAPAQPSPMPVVEVAEPLPEPKTPRPRVKLVDVKFVGINDGQSPDALSPMSSQPDGRAVITSFALPPAAPNNSIEVRSAEDKSQELVELPFSDDEVHALYVRFVESDQNFIGRRGTKKLSTAQKAELVSAKLPEIMTALAALDANKVPSGKIGLDLLHTRAKKPDNINGLKSVIGIETPDISQKEI